jgi:hypothetical protein
MADTTEASRFQGKIGCGNIHAHATDHYGYQFCVAQTQPELI